MEMRSDESNPQRPNGDRILNAPLLDSDLNSFMEQIKGEETWLKNDRNAVTIFKSDTLRIVLMGLHPNAELKPHKTKGAISLQVLEGEIHFITEEKSVLMKKQQLMVLHENITYGIKALTESFILLTVVMNNQDATKQ